MCLDRCVRGRLICDVIIAYDTPLEAIETRTCLVNCANYAEAQRRIIVEQLKIVSSKRGGGGGNSSDVIAPRRSQRARSRQRASSPSCQKIARGQLKFCRLKTLLMWPLRKQMLIVNRIKLIKLIAISIVIVAISHMAYRHLSSHLATTIKFYSNPLAAIGTLSAPVSYYSTMSADNYATVSYVTTPDESVARELAKKLVEGRLAACVNLVKNVESIYEWKGQIEKDEEVLMVIKSESHKSQELAEFVEKNHPYDCPEVVTLKVRIRLLKLLHF